MPHSLFREPTPAEAELIRRRLELSALRATLAAREHALSELRDTIVSFEGRYLRQVGLLLKQLDEWQRKIAELHAEHDFLGPAPASADDSEKLAADFSPPQKPKRVDLRALFRELAKRIHPDFALDAADEHRRTRWMAQANDALRREDASALQRMLDGFDGDAPPLTAEAECDRIVELARQVEHDIATVEAEITTLRESDSANLRHRAIEAALTGRDLLAEMATRVKGAISLAMRQYELDLTRIKNPPRGPRAEELVTAETAAPSPPRWDPKLRRWLR